MNDKEKAALLAIKLEGEVGTSPHSRQAIEEAFLEMAAWKDKEMQETIEVAEDHAFFAGSETMREKLMIKTINTDAFIEKACEWLKNNVTYTHPRTGETKCVVNLNAFIDAMKG